MPNLDSATVEALVTLVNAIAAGAALIIHAWNHTHAARRHPSDPPVTREASDAER
jgi:hypothetical protein